MRRRAFLSGVGAGAASGLAGCQLLGTTDPSSGDGPPRLRVDGRWLKDPSDNRVVLRGVNVVDPWWGTTYDDVRGKDYWDTLRLATDEDQGWHTRVLRVPIEPRSIDEVGLDTVVSEYLDRVVDLAREQGVYVVVDYHAVDRYDTEDIDNRITQFWERVAPRYAEDTHVLYELFNEPTEPRGHGLESWETWREYAQPWVDVVRDRAPATPLIVGSPRWTSLTHHAPEAPFEGDHLLYAGHVFPSWDPESWERTFGDPALDVPVFVTEWGYVNAEDDRTEPHMMASTSEWGEPFRAWLDSHANVSWSAWAFDSEWVPHMFDEEWNLLGGDDYMGEFTKQWLADRKDDHQPGDGEATATPASNRPPEPPVNLRTTERRPSRVSVAWDGATDPDGHGIVQYRVALDDREEQIRREAARSASFADLDPGTSYEVSVVAVDGRGTRSEAATLTVDTVKRTEPVESIPRTDEPPAIDGSVDDAWGAGEAHTLGNYLWGPESVDLAAEWYGFWDADALYVRVDVTDADRHVDSEEAWQDDIAELYLDPDHSRAAAYDGENDTQVVVRRGEDAPRSGANSIESLGDVEVATTETDEGWRVEMAVPWDLYDVTPTPGHLLGMDVHAVDDEDGGERDAKRAWYGTTDAAWENPRAFATVELAE